MGYTWILWLKRNAISCQHMLNLLLLLAVLVVSCVSWPSLAPCPCHCLNTKAVTMIQRTKNATAVINCARAAYSWSGNSFWSCTASFPTPYISWAKEQAQILAKIWQKNKLRVLMGSRQMARSHAWFLFLCTWTELFSSLSIIYQRQVIKFKVDCNVLLLLHC